MKFYSRKLIKPGDLNANNKVIEIGLEFKSIGRTSITFSCMVRNVFTKQVIISIDKLVFVKIDNDENPVPHHKTISNLGFEYKNQKPI